MYCCQYHEDTQVWVVSHHTHRLACAAVSHTTRRVIVSLAYVSSELITVTCFKLLAYAIFTAG